MYNVIVIFNICGLCELLNTPSLLDIQLLKNKCQINNFLQYDLRFLHFVFVVNQTQLAAKMKGKDSCVILFYKAKQLNSKDKNVLLIKKKTQCLF